MYGRLGNEMAKEKLSKPIFIISVDTEVIWGYVAYPTLKAVRLMKSDDKKVRGCIDILLNLFEKTQYTSNMGNCGTSLSGSL